MRKRHGFIFDGSIVILLVILALGVGILYGPKLRTLSSLKRVDDFPLYVMTYYGDYGFADFLKTGAHSDAEIKNFVIHHSLLGQAQKLTEGTKYACTAFSAVNPRGEAIFGRNFDYKYTPALLLYTDSPDGYASVSMVNLSFAGYSKEKLPDASWTDRFLLLGAPFLSFDGMNECGVTMALLAVPYSEPPADTNKVTLNTTTAIRLVLDYAKDVDEAVALLNQYNIYFSADTHCHYLIADRSGKSVIVEFMDEKVKVVPKSESWQTVTNFLFTGPDPDMDGKDRYDIANGALQQVNGTITESEAMGILQKVLIPNRTLWSMVYNQLNGSVDVVMGQKYDQVLEFQLKMR